MIHNPFESGRPDVAPTDVLVAVHVRFERRLRIVRMNDADPLDSKSAFHLSHGLVEAVGSVDGVPGGKHVRRIQADAEGEPLGKGENFGHFLEAPPNGGTLPGGIFHQQGQPVEVQSLGCFLYRPGAIAQRAADGAAFGASRMKHQVVGPEAQRAFDLSAERPDGFLSNFAVGGGRVNQIVVVDDQRAEAGLFTRPAKLPASLGRGGGGLPSARVGGKDLERVAADALGVTDGVGQRPCNRCVNSDPHRPVSGESCIA